MIGLVVGGVAVLVVIVAVVVVVMNRDHTISTPAVAGGMSRDHAAERRSSSLISAQRGILLSSGGFRAEEVKSAVYGREGDRYLFAGGTGDFDPGRLYITFRSGLDRWQNLTRTTAAVSRLYDAGGDGMAMCATIGSSRGTVSTAACVWMTESSFGLVSALSGAASRDTVASVMRRIRDDVED